MFPRLFDFSVVYEFKVLIRNDALLHVLVRHVFRRGGAFYRTMGTSTVFMGI